MRGGVLLCGLGGKDLFRMLGRLTSHLVSPLSLCLVLGTTRATSLAGYDSDPRWAVRRAADISTPC